MRNFSSLRLLSSPFLSNPLRRLPRPFSGLLKHETRGVACAILVPRHDGDDGGVAGSAHSSIDRSVSQSIKRTTSPLFCNYGWCGRGEGWGGGMGWDGILCVHVDLFFTTLEEKWGGGCACACACFFLGLGRPAV